MTDNDGFEILTGAIVPRLSIETTARTKHGKTWLALSAPGDLGVISLDPNCRSICEKYVRAQRNEKHPKKIHLKEFLRNPLATVDDINDIKKHWSTVRDAHYKLVDNKSIRTIVWDNGANIWGDCKLAYVGKDKIDPSSLLGMDGKPTGTRIGTQKTMPRDLGEAKREIREMVNAVDDKNLIILHPAEDEYRNDPSDSNKPGVKTGEIKRSGAMPGIEFLTQVEVRQTRDEITGQFMARLMSSTANSDIRGRKGELVWKNNGNVWVPSPDELVGDDINFAMIAMAVFPDSDWDSWQ